MKFSFPDHQRNQLLWILGATDQEETELTLINRVLQRYNGFTVPLRDITRAGIDISASRLIKKLLKDGFLRISKSEFELHPRYLNTYSELLTELKETYTNLQKAQTPITANFPSGSFSLVPEGTEAINIDDIASLYKHTELKNESLLEINFTANLPSIIIHSEFVQEFPFICWRKIRHYFALFAGENVDFFSEKIMSYKNLLIGRPRDLLEAEVTQLKRPTDKEYREECTRIILNRVIASNDASRQVIIDSISPQNGYILTRFSYNDRGDFDFLQALNVLKKYYTSKDKSRTPGPEDFLKGLKESISLCMQISDLKHHITETFPESNTDEVETNFQTFLGKYTGAAKDGKEVLGFTAPGKGDFLIHRDNLTAYLDSSGNRILRKIQSLIEQRWTAMIEQHRFEEAMLYDRSFKTLLSEFAAAENQIFSALVKKNELYGYLRTQKILSSIVSRLADYEFSEPDRVFALNRESIYEDMYKNIYSRFSLISSLVFRLFHWLARSVYSGPQDGTPQNSRKQGGQKPDKTSEQEVLSALGFTSKAESSTMLQELWNRLPVDILPRDEIDRNILTDLNSFYGDRKEVVFSTLDHIAERNLRRVLQKASHLEGYAAPLTEYIQAKMAILIATRPEMRNKTRF